MEQVLLVVQVIITLGLIIMVLIQRSDSDGFGLSGGSGNNLMSGRTTANVMTRTTAILAGLFMANALLLGIIAGRGHSSSIVDTIQAQEAQSGAVPSVPVEGDAKKNEQLSKDAQKAFEKAAPAKDVQKPDAKVTPEVPAADATSEPVKNAAKKVVKKSEEFDPNTAESTNE